MRSPLTTGRVRSSALAGVLASALLSLLPSGVAIVRADEAIIAPPSGAGRVPLLLRRLQSTHRVLYVTAHPDDEDAGLISRLVHGEGVDVTLLTLTRGNGGQNEIGEELHGAIAALRTAELESAHRWDGAEQWFGSADDFGYSFSVEETEEVWGRTRMLRELVLAIRLHRPDVILTLPPDGEGGGQHHQASARLTDEAWEIAATTRWPDLGPPHRTARLFSVIWGDTPAAHPCEVPLGDYDPLLGGSHAEIGSRSRAMHKCQGMVTVEPPLPRRKARLELRRDADAPLGPRASPLAGVPDRLLDGPEGRSGLGERIDRLRRSLEDSFDAAAIPSLLEARAIVASVAEEEGEHPALASLLDTLDRLLAEAVGLRTAAVTAAPFVAPDEGALVTLAAESWRGVPLRLELSLIAPGVEPIAVTIDLPAEGGRQLRTAALPRGLRPSLLDGPIRGEIPAAEPAVRLEGRVVLTEREGASFPLVPRAVEGEWRDEVFPRLRRTDLRVVPDPSIRPGRAVELAPRDDDAAELTSPSARGEFLLSTITPATVEVLLAPDTDGWQVEPRSLRVETPGGGIEVPVPFTVLAPASLAGSGHTARATIRAVASRRDGGRVLRESRRGYRRIEHPHIRTTGLEEAAEIEVVSFPCRVRDRAIGFVEGVGDALPWAMRSLGLAPVLLDRDTLTEGDLDRFEVIVLGVRAYKVRDDLRAAQPRLMAWVEAGGTLVVQYHKLEFNDADGTSPFVPFPGARVGRGRITDERALVAAEDPDHPLLAAPNRIDARDWAGWVQERGLYFLELRAGTPYLDLLTIADSFPYNAGIRGGALVEAPVGEGRWIYVGLGLWRQAPAGVPGALRLLANLLAR